MSWGDICPIGKLPVKQILPVGRFFLTEPCFNIGAMPASRKKLVPQPTLKAWRDFRDLTLEQMGNIIGKSAQAVHKWEAGKVPVTLDNLALLAQAYGTEPARLLFMPDEGALEDRYRRAHSVLSSLDDNRASRWLEMGEDLAALPASPLALPPPDKKKLAH